MRKNLIGRLTAFTMAMAVICGGAASCSSSEKGTSSASSQAKGASNEAEQAKANVATSLKAEAIDLDCDFRYISSMILVPDSDKIVISASADSDDGKKKYMYVTDKSLTEIKTIELELENADKDNYIQLVGLKDGTICVLQTINDYGDMEIPEEYDEDFDYEALEEARETTYYLYNVDLDGKVLSSTKIEGLEEYAPSEDFYLNDILSFGDNIAASLSSAMGDGSKMVVLDKSGKVLGDMDTDGLQWLMGAAETNDGKVVIGGYTTMGMKLKYFDVDGMKATGDEIELSDSTLYNINDMMKGDDNYAIYANTMSGLYGIKADGSTTEIVNWADCDLDTTESIKVIPLDGGEYAVFNGGDDSGFYRLVQRDASEMDNTKIITIGTLYDDYEVTDKINKFNKSHDDIRIKAVNYEKYNDYDEETETVNNSAASQLRMDIVAGKAPDMIVTYDSSVISSLAGKDIFADLYGLMDSDLKKEDILDNVLEASEIDGKLLSLAPSFYVQTLACKSKYCDIENWTFDDMKKTYESLPDGMGLCEIDSNEAVLQLVLPGIANYVDYSTNTCSFDNPEFKEMIEFCSQFPDTEDIIDWKNASDEELNEFTDDMMSKFKEDRALLSSMYLSDFRSYNQAKQGTFDDDITLVGTPSDNGEGAHLYFVESFAILDSSDAKAECWDFIKSFFTEEAYKDGYQFPVVKKYFDEMADASTKKRTYTDEDGKEHEVDDSMYIDGKEIKIDPLSEEDKKYVIDYVTSIKTASTELPDDILQIGNDCLKAYFKGEKSLDETVSLLQSKVSILLSEQS
ncbi:MAG: extracellular solute-binding protein [Ruminococcus sp.]|nr:extracellular solute-binding protein [Ruminococcus sp.]